MTASKACLDLIKEFESLKLESYLCPAGVWTIGYGHTHGVHEGQTISREMAEALLLEDVKHIEWDLRLMTTGLKLTQGMWDALVSLCFNLKGGARRLPVIAPKLWRYMKAGRRHLASAELLDINKANGKELPGLTRRRKAEQALFLTPDPEYPTAA